ncbi:MAG: hypothetical protein IKH65_00015 [Clostridia bacterium]|nr:hypothetical protein [Clostridia bacterium]
MASKLIKVICSVYETMVNPDHIIEIRKVTHDKYRIELQRGSVEVTYNEYTRIMDVLGIPEEERV